MMNLHKKNMGPERRKMPLTQRRRHEKRHTLENEENSNPLLPNGLQTVNSGERPLHELRNVSLRALEAEEFAVNNSQQGSYRVECTKVPPTQQPEPLPNSLVCETDPNFVLAQTLRLHVSAVRNPY
ncbi:MAG: hypothetical protein ACI96M_002873 [Candidatus Azotimanducaceae bacterium]|jgi:hypothetical protein